MSVCMLYEGNPSIKKLLNFGFSPPVYNCSTRRTEPYRSLEFRRCCKNRTEQDLIGLIQILLEQVGTPWSEQQSNFCPAENTPTITLMYLERLEYSSYFIRGSLFNTPPSIAAIIILRFAVLKHCKLLLGHFTISPCNQVGPFNQKSKSCLKAAKVNPRVSKSAGFSRVGTYLK